VYNLGIHLHRKQMLPFGWSLERMKSLTSWVLFCVAVLAGPAAPAAGSAEAGATKAVACQGCHGPNGNSVNDQWPTLAGQNAVYVKAQLVNFHKQVRLNPSGLMTAMGATLSDADIEDVAAYFAAQTVAGLEADPSYWKAGEKLYRGGDRARAIPACMACHGPAGAGNPAAGYPALRAQHTGYTIQQLTEYAADQRYTRDAKGESNGGPYGLIMHTIAQRLSQEDIRNLASYIQGMR
jgi:cytochrome c553